MPPIDASAQDALIIDLTDMRVLMRLGLHDFEKAREQTVLISARLELDPALIDSGTICDYDRLYAFIKGFGGQAIETQEELVSVIARFAVQLDGVRRVTIASKKPDVYPEAAYVGVSRTLSRPQG